MGRDAGPKAAGGCAAGAAAPALDERVDTLDAACRLLLRTGSAVPLDRVAAELGLPLAEVEQVVAEQERRGRLERDGTGAVVVSAGVSARPHDYELHVGSVRLWASCAKTALGVLGAFGAGGWTATTSPTGRPVRADFDGARPVDPGLAVFWPSDTFRDSCTSAADEYCPSFRLFESVEAARRWAAARRAPGEVLPIRVATDRAVSRWAASLDLAGRGRGLADAVTAGSAAAPAAG